MILRRRKSLRMTSITHMYTRHKYSFRRKELFPSPTRPKTNAPYSNIYNNDHIYIQYICHDTMPRLCHAINYGMLPRSWIVRHECPTEFRQDQRLNAHSYTQTRSHECVSYINIAQTPHGTPHKNPYSASKARNAPSSSSSSYRACISFARMRTFCMCLLTALLLLACLLSSVLTHCTRITPCINCVRFSM